LATRFYGAIDRREFSDLDILVKREQVGAVELLLRGAGYARKSRVLFSTAVTSRFTHAFDFAKGNVSVDLHWLLSANAAHYLDYEAIWRQRQNFILRGQDFLVLSDEHEIAFKLISIFKDLEISAIHLKSFVDLYFILSAVSPGLDWKEFLEHRRREKILRISVNVLAFFFELFNCRHRFPDVASGKVRARPPVKQVNIP
ncbi:MAG: nucleotidyltransferase family protein, partial [Candidatus Binatia bacterium]